MSFEKTNAPIGAKCTIKWLSDGGLEAVYISFGEYNEETGQDGYGVDDCLIWGYSDNVEGIAEAYEHEIKILDTEIIYQEVTNAQ